MPYNNDKLISEFKKALKDTQLPNCDAAYLLDVSTGYLSFMLSNNYVSTFQAQKLDHLIAMLNGIQSMALEKPLFRRDLTESAEAYSKRKKIMLESVKLDFLERLRMADKKG